MGISNHGHLSEGKKTKFPSSYLLSLSLAHTQINAHASDCPACIPHLVFTPGNRVSHFYSIDRVWESKNVVTFSDDPDTFKTLIFEQLPTQEKKYR